MRRSGEVPTVVVPSVSPGRGRGNAEAVGNKKEAPGVEPRGASFSRSVVVVDSS